MNRGRLGVTIVLYKAKREVHTVQQGVDTGIYRCWSLWKDGIAYQ